MTHTFPAVIMKGNFKIREETHGITFFTPSNHIGCLQEPWWGVSRLVLSDSLRPHGLEPTRLLCPWNSPGKKSGVGYHSLLQGIFQTQGSNSSPPRCKQRFFRDFFFPGSLGKSRTLELFPKPQSSGATFRKFAVTACSAATVYFINTYSLTSFCPTRSVSSRCSQDNEVPIVNPAVSCTAINVKRVDLMLAVLIIIKEKLFEIGRERGKGEGRDVGMHLNVASESAEKRAAGIRFYGMSYIMQHFLFATLSNNRIIF